MPTMRGLIKIVAASDDSKGLTADLINLNDFLSEMAPIASQITDWIAGKRGDYDTRERESDWQKMATYLRGGYLLYADDLELTYHGKGTDGYNGVGGNSQVQTNSEPYREITFNTTISQRDADLPIGPVDALRRGGNLFDIIGQTVQYGIDSLAGVAELKAYYQKRADFLRDLDDVEVICSSTMFKPLQGYTTNSKMKMQGGQTEATFQIGVKEMSTLTSPGTDTAHSFSLEPGAGW